MTNEKQIEALKYEISVLKGRLQPHDTGHIHTAISVLQERIEELENAYNPRFVFTRTISESPDYKLRMNVTKNKRPAGTYSIDFVQCMYKNNVLTDTSTYNYHLDMTGIDNLIEALNDILEDNALIYTLDKQDIALAKSKCHMEIDSPYNDGYTKEFYRKELDRLNVLYEST